MTLQTNYFPTCFEDVTWMTRITHPDHSLAEKEINYRPHRHKKKEVKGAVP